MPDDTMALIEALQKADDGNFLRSLAESVLQTLMEADLSLSAHAVFSRRPRKRDRSWSPTFRLSAISATEVASGSISVPSRSAAKKMPRDAEIL